MMKNYISKNSKNFCIFEILILKKYKQIDKNNNSIQNARINLLKENNNYVKYKKTNTTGQVTFQVVPNANMKVQIDYNGNKYIETINQSNNQKTISLLPYSIQILNSNNEPVQNVRINLLKENNNYVKYKKTDTNGTVTFNVVPNSNHKFQIDYNGAKYSINVNNETQIIQNLIPLTTTIIDSDNQPIENVRINLLKENNNYVKYKKTNSNGTITFQTVPNSNMKIQIDYNGNKYSELINQSNSPKTIQTLQLKNNFLNEICAPVQNIRINLLKENNNYVKYKNTNQNGTTTFQVLPNSNHNLELNYNNTKHYFNLTNINQNTNLNLITPFNLGCFSNS